MGVFTPQPTSAASEVSAEPAEISSLVENPLETAAPADPAELLQFTSGGHVLGFEPNGVYLATGGHMLREEFAGTQGVTPIADQPPSADPSTSSGQAPSTSPSGTGQAEAQPLGTVTYPNLWPGITLVYDSPPGGIIRSTYHVDAGADPGQIALRYNTPVRIDDNGSLVFEFETGILTASAPLAWHHIFVRIECDSIRGEFPQNILHE